MKRLLVISATALLLTAGAGCCRTMQEFCAKFRPGYGSETCYDPCYDSCGGCHDGCGAGYGAVYGDGRSACGDGCDPYGTGTGVYQSVPSTTTPGVAPGPETYTPSL
jgi:hypothetical protein